MPHKPEYFSTMPPPPELQEPMWIDQQMSSLRDPEIKDGVYQQAEITTAITPECYFATLDIETQTASISGQTDVGGENSRYNTSSRHTNESGYAVLVDNHRLLLAVGDGAGGTGRGRQAFRAFAGGCVEAFRNKLPPKDADLVIDQRVREESREDALDPKHGYGAGALIFVDPKKDGRRAQLVIAGDTQIFTIRDGQKLEEGSTDPQTYAWESEVATGKIHPRGHFNHLSANILTSNYGGNVHSPVFKNFEYHSNDLLILADDGVRGVVSEYEMLKIAQEEEGDPKKIQERIFSLAIVRQNSRTDFTIELSDNPDDTVSFCVNDAEGIEEGAPLPDERKGGDNIVILVAKLH